MRVSSVQCHHSRKLLKGFALVRAQTARRMATPTAALARFTYFNGRGHGQRIRYALASAGIDWEEVLLTQPGDMDAVRPECLFGQVPMLEIDGIKLFQSWSIVRYIASKEGLSPADNARADAFAEQVRDMYTEAAFVSFGWGPDRDAAMQVVRAAVAKGLPKFEHALTEPFILGSKPCWADFQLLLALDYVVDLMGEAALQPFPKLTVHRAALRALPSMQKFYASEFNKGLVDASYIKEVRTAMGPKV